MLLAKCLALPVGPKQRREGWSNFVECPLLSALLYAQGLTCTVRSSMYRFFYKVIPLATCSRFSAATGCFLCRNGFLPGVLDNNPENHRFTLPTVCRFALPSEFEIQRIADSLCRST